MQAKLFLLTTVETDQPTRYLVHWSRPLEEEARSRGFEVVTLHQEKAVRKNLESRIESRPPSLLMFNAHGSPEEIAGFDGKPMLRAGENEHVAKGLVVYARTCSAAAVLGRKCAEKGAKAFIGYSWFFTFPTDNNDEAHPLNDELAAPVLKTSNAIVEALLKGSTVREAIGRSAQHMEKEIEFIKSSRFNHFLEAPLVIGCLKLNQRILTVCGNNDAAIT